MSEIKTASDQKGILEPKAGCEYRAGQAEYTSTESNGLARGRGLGMRRQEESVFDDTMDRLIAWIHSEQLEIRIP